MMLRAKRFDWSYGARSLQDTADWQRVRTRFIVPPGVAEIQPRLIGYGPVTVWVDDFSLEKTGHVTVCRGPILPAWLSITNATLEVALNTSNATLSVLDRRTGQRFEQIPLSNELILTDATAQQQPIPAQADSRLDRPGNYGHDSAGKRFARVHRRSVGARRVAGRPARSRIRSPRHPGEYLVVPMNEGISYPVEDQSIEPFSLVAYGGHGICMAFWGATDGERGHMAIIETPDDASIRIERHDGLLGIAPQWDAQHGQFGYARRLRYVFFDQGGHVAMAKRYRAYAQKIGLFKTLEQKRAENPNVDLLVGAVNVWCWERDARGSW